MFDSVSLQVRMHNVFEYVLLSPCTARVGSMPIVAWVSVPPAHDKTNNLSKSLEVPQFFGQENGRTLVNKW